MIRGNTNHFFLRYHLVTAGRIYRETRETWNQVQSEALPDLSCRKLCSHAEFKQSTGPQNLSDLSSLGAVNTFTMVQAGAYRSICLCASTSNSPLTRKRRRNGVRKNTSFSACKTTVLSRQQKRQPYSP